MAKIFMKHLKMCLWSGSPGLVVMGGGREFEYSPYTGWNVSYCFVVNFVMFV